MGEQMEITVNSIANEYYNPEDLPSLTAQKRLRLLSSFHHKCKIQS